MCAASVFRRLERRLAEHDLADRVVDDLLEARHVRALLVRAEVDEALELGVEELLGADRALIRMTFSTPVTPTRERLTWERKRPALDVAPTEHDSWVGHGDPEL